MSEKVNKIVFNNGEECPMVGLGTWRAGRGEVGEAVRTAIELGYRHIDCAPLYENEKEVGQALAEKIQDGSVTRKELFITTKLWNTCHRRELVVAALRESLSNLGLTYVDLFLVHWPTGFKAGEELFPLTEGGKVEFSADTSYLDAWAGMEDCVRLGLATSIGLSNFNSRQVEEVLRVCTVKPVTNQVECHPELSQRQLIDWCRERGVTVTAYRPLGCPGGALPTGHRTPIIQHPTVLDIATALSKTPAQVLIRYQLERGVIVIPKSVRRERLESNLAVFDFKLSSSQMDSLYTMDIANRICTFDCATQHKDYPFNIEF